MSRGAKQAPARTAPAARMQRRPQEAGAEPRQTRSPGLSNQLMQATAGGGTPLDPATRRHSEARLGVDLADVRLHRGAAVDRVTAGLGARALARGDSIMLGKAADRRSLGHELVHVAQSRRFGQDDEASVSEHDDPAEREARHLSDDIWRPGPVLPVEQAPRAAVSRNDGPVPNVNTPPAPASPDPGWSFDPYDEEVVNLGNTQLVLRTLAVRQWLTNHSIIELDYEAYMILRDRLDLERDFRIELGHLWLEDIEQGATMSLVRLMQGANGAIDVVSITDPDLIDGPAQDLGGEPIMSMGQFEAYQAAQRPHGYHIR